METEAPVEEPTEEPVETEAPVEEPTEEPVETEAPVEEPTEAPVEEPTEEPVETEAPSERVQDLINRIEALPGKEAAAVTENFSLLSFESLEAEIAELMALVDQLSADELAMVTNLEKLLDMEEEAETTRKRIDEVIGNLYIKVTIPQFKEIFVGETILLEKNGDYGGYCWDSQTHEDDYRVEYDNILRYINYYEDEYPEYQLKVKIENENSETPAIERDEYWYDYSENFIGVNSGNANLVIYSDKLNVKETIKVRVREPIDEEKIDLDMLLLDSTEFVSNINSRGSKRLPVTVIINGEKVDFSSFNSANWEYDEETGEENYVQPYQMELKVSNANKKDKKPVPVDVRFDDNGYLVITLNDNATKAGTYTVQVDAILKKNGEVVAEKTVSSPIKVKVINKNLSMDMNNKITFYRFDEMKDHEWHFYDDNAGDIEISSLYEPQEIDAYVFDGVSYWSISSLVITDSNSPFEFKKVEGDYYSQYYLIVKNKLDKSSYKVKCQATATGSFKAGFKPTVNFVMNITVKNNIPKLKASSVTLIRGEENPTPSSVEISLPGYYSNVTFSLANVNNKTYPCQNEFGFGYSYDESDNTFEVAYPYYSKGKFYFNVPLKLKNPSSDALKNKKSVKVLLQVEFEEEDGRKRASKVQVPVTVQLKDNTFTYKLNKSTITLNKKATGEIAVKLTCSPAKDYIQLADDNGLTDEQKELFDVKVDNYYGADYEQCLLVGLKPDAIDKIDKSSYKLTLKFENAAKDVALTIKLIDKAATAKLKKNTFTLERSYSDAFDSTQIVFSQQAPQHAAVKFESVDNNFDVSALYGNYSEGRLAIFWGYDTTQTSRPTAGTYKLRVRLTDYEDEPADLMTPLTFTLKVVQKAKLTVKLVGTLDTLSAPQAGYSDIGNGVLLTNIKLLNTSWSPSYYDDYDISIEENQGLLMLRKNNWYEYCITWKDFGAVAMTKYLSQKKLAKIPFRLKITLGNGDVFTTDTLYITPKQPKNSVYLNTGSLSDYGWLKGYTYKGTVMLHQKYPNLVGGIHLHGYANTGLIISDVKISGKKANDYEIFAIRKQNDDNNDKLYIYGIRYKNGKAVTTVNDSIKLEVYLLGAQKPVYVTVKIKNLK